MVSYIEPPKTGVPPGPMCAGRGPTDIPMCLSQFLCSPAHMAPAFRNKGSHGRVRLSVLVLSIFTRFLSHKTQSLTGPDTVITSTRVNSSCLLEKSTKAAAQPQSSLGRTQGRRHKGRTQPRRKEGECRFTPTAVDVSSIPHRAEAVVFVQSLWDTGAPVLAWLGVTRL